MTYSLHLIKTKIPQPTGLTVIALQVSKIPGASSPGGFYPNLGDLRLIPACLHSLRTV